jgi:2'-5' RNA ligase
MRRRFWRRRTGPETVLIVPIEAGPAFEAIRSKYDRSSPEGVPAHVTTLYPFVPLAKVDERVLSEVAALAKAQPPFDVSFTRLGRFPGVLYAAPEPADVFIALTMACVERYPQHQPYKGAFDDVVPHMTVSDTVEPEGLEAEAEALLPINCRASELWMMAQTPRGGWTEHTRFPLGG